MTKGYNHEGKTLPDLIVEDVRTHLTTTLSQEIEDVDPAQQKRIIDAIMDKKTDKLSPADQAVLATVKDHYEKALEGPDNNVASDVFGGATGNVIRGDYGHEDDYWDGKDYLDRAASEAWAGYSARNVIGGQGLTSVEDFLPKTSEALHEMAKNMKDN